MGKTSQTRDTAAAERTECELNFPKARHGHRCNCRKKNEIAKGGIKFGMHRQTAEYETEQPQRAQGTSPKMEMTRGQSAGRTFRKPHASIARSDVPVERRMKLRREVLSSGCTTELPNVRRMSPISGRLWSYLHRFGHIYDLQKKTTAR